MDCLSINYYLVQKKNPYILPLNLVEDKFIGTSRPLSIIKLLVDIHKIQTMYINIWSGKSINIYPLIYHTHKYIQYTLACIYVQVTDIILLDVLLF